MASSAEEVAANAQQFAETFNSAELLVNDAEDNGECSACVLISDGAVPGLIGRGGANINAIKECTGSNMSFSKKETSIRGSRKLFVSGTVASVTRAVYVVTSLAGSGVSCGLIVADQSAGKVIGKGGENLKNIREQTGCKLQLEKREEATPANCGRSLIVSHPDNLLNAIQAIYLVLRTPGFDSPSSRDINAMAGQVSASPMQQSFGGFDMGGPLGGGMDMYQAAAFGSYGMQPQQTRFSPYGSVGADQNICAVHGKRRGRQNLQQAADGSFICKPEDACKGGGAMRGAGGAGVPGGSAFVCSTHGKKRGERNLEAHPAIPGTFVCKAEDMCK